MPAIPPWATGRQYTALTVQPLKADINGVLTTNGSALSFLTILEGFSYAGEDTVEPINAAGATVENEVGVERNDSWVLSEIMRRGQAQCNLTTIWENTGRTEYAKITYTRSGNSMVAYVLMEDLRESGGAGKWVASLQFSFVDAGGDVTANPSYT
jgi:hypothetical protein